MSRKYTICKLFDRLIKCPGHQTGPNCVLLKVSQDLISLVLKVLSVILDVKVFASL